MNYFAAGWFSKEQNELYDRLARILKQEFGGLEWFFPRDAGINLMEVPIEERKFLLKKVFALDTCMILVTMKTDGFILAVIDDYDVGMVWEAGFAFGISLGKLPVVTYTDKNYGLNVMFRESAVAHIRGTDELREFLCRYMDAGANTAALLKVAKDYKNFSEEVF